MEILSALLLAISPLLVSFITQLVKPPKWVISGGFRDTVLRFGVALLSFCAVVGTSFLSSQEVDAVTIDTFAQAIIVFIGATGTYFWAKTKKVSA